MNFKFLEERKIEANKLKNDFIDRMVSIGGDKNIIKFIADIRYHTATGEVSIKDSCESIRTLFEAGYCYYFARMLEEAFPGGEICITSGAGHMVYVYNSIAYDFSGISDAEYDVLIPIKGLDEKYYKGFLHIPEYEDNLTAHDVIKLVDEYKAQNKIIKAKGYHECYNG